MITTLVFTALTALSSDVSCAEVFDSTAECKSPKGSIFITPGEAVTVPTYDETPLEVDSDTLGVQFLALSAVPAAIAVMMHATTWFYGYYFDGVRAERTVSAAEADQNALVQQSITYGALAMWLSSAMVAGTGVAFFVFDPKDGSVRDSLKIP